ncbi:MAG: hypothetical protein ACI3Z8_02755 [Paludibacteraceae bacterium]
MNLHKQLPPLPGCMGLIPFALSLLVCAALYSPPVFSSPQLSEHAVSRYVSDIASPFSLPSEHTAARMEMRKSNSWREPWYGSVTGAESVCATPVYAQSFNHSARALFGSTWREEVPFQAPLQSTKVPTVPLDEMYSYRSYASTITSVGATSVALMAVPAGESPIQKISGRQGADDWFDDNPDNPGNVSNESPVGEPMILLLFALGLVVYRYQRNLLKNNRL